MRTTQMGAPRFPAHLGTCMASSRLAPTSMLPSCRPLGFKDPTSVQRLLTGHQQQRHAAVHRTAPCGELPKGCQAGRVLHGGALSREFTKSRQAGSVLHDVAPSRQLNNICQAGAVPPALGASNEVEVQEVQKVQETVACNKVPVVLLPGFLQSSSMYTKVAETLNQMGHPTTIAPVCMADWIPTLAGATFTSLLDCMHTEILRWHEMHGGSGRIVVVGFSAGGWLARILLGEEPYDGRVWGCSSKVSSLVTLGSPHQSQELYPFGRAVELRQGERSDLPDDVKGSSIRFARYFYPRADSLPNGVRVVTCVGRATEGKAWKWSALLELLAGGVEVLIPYLAHASYVTNCGQGEVMGDCVVPIESALLPGALHATLGDVWHTPQGVRSGKRWYGSPEVVAYWERFLE